MSLSGISVHDVLEKQIDGSPQESSIFQVSQLSESGRILKTKRGQNARTLASLKEVTLAA